MKTARTKKIDKLVDECAQRRISGSFMEAIYNFTIENSIVLMFYLSQKQK